MSSISSSLICSLVPSKIEPPLEGLIPTIDPRELPRLLRVCLLPPPPLILPLSVVPRILAPAMLLPFIIVMRLLIDMLFTLWPPIVVLRLGIMVLVLKVDLDYLDCIVPRLVADIVSL